MIEREERTDVTGLSVDSGETEKDWKLCRRTFMIVFILFFNSNHFFHNFGHAL